MPSASLIMNFGIYTFNTVRLYTWHNYIISRYDTIQYNLVHRHYGTVHMILTHCTHDSTELRIWQYHSVHITLWNCCDYSTSWDLGGSQGRGQPQAGDKYTVQTELECGMKLYLALIHCVHNNMKLYTWPLYTVHLALHCTKLWLLAPWNYILTASILCTVYLTLLHCIPDTMLLTVHSGL